ncbi:carboxypeptidase-like regulatory domain-containing protein [Puia dinghuensis]|uniref:TonB C-terminal domain-containing protein n=1 Tax=Puia dinghuensis TaxID=1792502 RepID=A0A8J2UAD4_9BACT|nr:carboxypeptidase-like regulatory domain-containing protein [Puia dinghuensis]GGA89448.1 hypothetical protein GCM10011511_10840 [Puia dinghuensis]
MNNTDNHTNSWSDADIRKYGKGELSAREMHELEKAALEDPFLSDALEGLAATPHPGEDLDELRARLATRVEEKKQRSRIGWFSRPAFRVAAAIILLAGLCFTAYNLLLNRKEPSPAASTVAKATEKPATVPLPLQPAPQQQPAAVADSTKAQDFVAVESHRQVNHTRKPAPITVTLRSTPAADTEFLAKEAADAQEAPKPAPTIAAQQGYLKNMAYKQAYPRLLFSGRVVDANDKPLAHAYLNLNGNTNTFTTTDNRGQFNFKVVARDTTQPMTVSLEGYQPTSFSLSTSTLTNNVIRLQEAKSSMDEVLVTGYGAKRRETLTAAPSDSDERLDSAWLKVFPVIGRLAYEQYLATAKKTLSVDSTIRGTERISFQVDQKGQLTEFKIEQSLSPAHDAGLIQLISGGPAWRLLRGKKARAIVSLSFP